VSKTFCKKLRKETRKKSKVAVFEFQRVPEALCGPLGSTHSHKAAGRARLNEGLSKCGCRIDTTKHLPAAKKERTYVRWLGGKYRHLLPPALRALLGREPGPSRAPGRRKEVYVRRGAQGLLAPLAACLLPGAWHARFCISKS
jgi:hypothetical protein